MSREVANLFEGIVIAAPAWLIRAAYYSKQTELCSKELSDEKYYEYARFFVWEAESRRFSPEEAPQYVSDLKAFSVYLRELIDDYNFEEYCIVECFESEKGDKVAYFKPDFIEPDYDFYEEWKGMHCVPCLGLVNRESAFWYIPKRK